MNEKLPSHGTDEVMRFKKKTIKHIVSRPGEEIFAK